MRVSFRTLLLLLTALAIGGVWEGAAASSDVPAQFDAANKLYEEGKFTEAVAAYEAIRQGGVTSPALYFNLGNALFKSARIGRALAAYRRAEQLSPRDPDVRANLRFTRNQVQGPTKLPSRIERWLRMLSLNEWTTLAAVSFWLTFISLAAAQLKPRLAQSLRNLTIIAAVAMAIFITCLGLAFAYQAGTETAIVVVHEVPVRNGPFDESPDAFKVHDGAELQVLDRKDNWLQVTDGRRRPGWLRLGYVTLLNRL